jgi:SAM-dependent methyltransferase
MIKNLKHSVYYYFSATYRRKKLDKLLEKNKHYYKGIVLDIGGRNRGKFEKPKDRVEKWIFADINKKYNPDIVLDVCDMNQIQDENIDVINVLELFEHVKSPVRGLKECYRVLKKNGIMILSVPFLSSIHSDPHDFQRWTEEKWKKVLLEIGFKIENIEIMGRYFTVAMDMKKTFIGSLPFGIRHFFKFFYPLMDLIAKIDSTEWVKNDQKLNKFHGGYFMILKK